MIYTSAEFTVKKVVFTCQCCLYIHDLIRRQKLAKALKVSTSLMNWNTHTLQRRLANERSQALDGMPKGCVEFYVAPSESNDGQPR